MNLAGVDAGERGGGTRRAADGVAWLRAAWGRAAEDRAAEDRAAEDRAAENRAAEGRGAADRAGGSGPATADPYKYCALYC